MPANERTDHTETLQIYALKVNNLTTPLGMEDLRPQFSWQLQSQTRGIELAAAQIRIATSLEQLHRNQADVWNSEIVIGKALTIDYSGPDLIGYTRYWWKVAVWTATEQYAESEPTYWDMGLLLQDWQAEWIWSSRKVRVNDFAYFRKEVKLRQTIAYAKLFVSAHNVAQVYIDGVRIGGYGSPAPTLPWKHKYYLAYDVTAFLRSGKNCIAALAHFLGGGGQNYVNGLPGFRAQLEVLYSDGTKECFKSDSTWGTLKEIPHNTGTPYQQNRCISAIEDFDARKLDSNWMYVGFDKQKSKKAAISRIGKNEWPMKWQEIPEGAIKEVIVPTSVDVPTYSSAEMKLASEDNFAQIFDTGKIVSGWPRFSLEGISGVTVCMRYSEDLDEHGYVKHNVTNETSEHYYDQYIMRGDKVEAWQPDFSYKAFRYVEVTGYPNLIQPGLNLEIISARTDIPYEGSFHCSNSLLNELYEVSIQTQKNNILGQIVDCPHREQAQYLADSDLQAELLLYNFASNSLLEKVISDFADAQLDDGTFPFVFPSNFENPAFNIQIPEWDLHYCTILWKTYFFYGDKRLLERYYLAAKRMVDYYFGILDTKTGLVPIDKGWHISDWPYPTVDHSSNYLTVQNVKLAQAARIVAEIASLIGSQQDHAVYTQLVHKLEQNMVKWLYDVEHKHFQDCFGSGQAHQGVNAIALLYGLVPEADRKQAIAYIANRPWECKTVLALPLLRILFENGHKALAYGLINREEYPGWGYMIKQGAKTLWEGWDDIESHCHAWNGYPARLLQEYIAGIQSTSPGFADILIKPYMPADLMFAEAAVPTVRGLVRVRWERTTINGSFRIEACIPPSMNARLIFSLEKQTTDVLIKEADKVVWEKGRFSATVSGINQCEFITEGIEIELTSGEFDFNIEMK